MGVNRMTGTPWHTEQLRIGEEDSRRHRSRCKYYNHTTKRCSKMVDKCIGSTYCENYEEDPIKQKEREKRELINELQNRLNNELSARKKQEEQKPVLQPARNYLIEYPVNSRVIHEKYGKGLVKNHLGGKLTIQLDNGKELRLDPKYCFEKDILMRI